MAKDFKLVALDLENISALKEIAPSCNQAITIILQILEDNRWEDMAKSASIVRGELTWKKNKTKK